MKKHLKERPTTEISHNFEIETKTSKEEVESGKFDIKELEALMAALSLLINTKNIDGGTLEIKTDPITKRETATVYQNSDHKPVFMTEEEIEIHYLRNPKKSLEMFVTELKERQATNKVLREIQTNSFETNPKKIN